MIVCDVLFLFFLRNISNLVRKNTDPMQDSFHLKFLSYYWHHCLPPENSDNEEVKGQEDVFHDPLVVDLLQLTREGHWIGAEIVFLLCGMVLDLLQLTREGHYHYLSERIVGEIVFLLCGMARHLHMTSYFRQQKKNPFPRNPVPCCNTIFLHDIGFYQF